MSQRLKALKDKTGKFVYFFPIAGTEFSPADHTLVTVEVREIKSQLCAMCSGYDICNSALRGKDLDCSSYDNQLTLKK